jgi:hypothetical protein
MIITITVSEDKVLQAINKAFKDQGRPDGLDDPKYIDEQDIAQHIVPRLDIEADAIEIER